MNHPQWRLKFTTFKNRAADTKAEKECTWDALVSALTNPKTYKDKLDCPLIKLSTFGDVRSSKGSLRTNKNQLELHGVEIDYDRETMTVDEARQCLANAGVEAFIYTSASHQIFDPDTGGFKGNRWRVLLPLSKPHDPVHHRRLVGMANTILGGVASGESFSRSQAFFYGKVLGSQYECARTHGAALDSLVIDPTYPKGAEQADATVTELKDPREKTDIVGAFCRAYSTPEAIAEFLPHVFTHANAHRYTWTGHIAEGVFVSPDQQHAGASHDSWPWGTNRVVNTFDLVRQFKFDPEQLEDTSVPEYKRDSYRSMCEWAASLPEVQACANSLASGEFSVLSDDMDYFDSLETIEDTPAKRDRFVLIPAAEFAGADIDSEWHIRDVLPRADLSVMYGASGSGKSFIALDLVMAVVRGEAWRGHRTVKTRVAYIAAEGSGGFRKRIKAFSRKNDIPLEDIDLYVVDAAPNFLELMDTTALASAINKIGGVGLIVVDTWAQVLPGANENASEDMGKALKHCRGLQRATGASILLIHHAGKDAAKGSRGWSGLRAAADAELEVTSSSTGRMLRVAKMKDGRDNGAWGFDLEVVPLFVNSYGETVDSCVVIEAELVKQDKPMSELESLAFSAFSEFAIAQSTGIEIDAVAEEATRKYYEMNNTPKSNKQRDNKKLAIKKAIKRMANREVPLFILDDDETSISAIGAGDL